MVKLQTKWTKQMPLISTHDRASSAIEVIRKVMGEHPVTVAWSGGKDSSAVLVMALMAYVSIPKEDRHWPLFVTHNDTEVENPVVSALAQENIAALERWAGEMGHDVRVIVTRPRLADSFVVNILGGGQLPTYPETKHRVCTNKLKIDPAKNGLRIIRDMLGTAPSVVSLVGTRFDESAHREAAMRARDEREDELRDVEGRLFLSPIATWSVVDVWNILSVAGTNGNEYPVWRDTLLSIMAVYSDASGGECPIESSAAKNSAGCGARFGCATCCAVGTDQSMTIMTEDARFHHLRPLLKARDFLMNIRHDWSRRNMVTRQTRIENNTLSVKIQPDHFNSETLLSLVGAYLLADHDEQQRAVRFDAALRAGAMPDDPYVAERQAAGKRVPASYLEKMRRPQFRFIDTRHLIGLDFYSSVLAKYERPYTVVELAYRIRHEGFRPVLPVCQPVPKTPAPAGRWVSFPLVSGDIDGLGDPLAMAFGDESCFSHDDIHSREDGMPYHARASSSFDVDEEGAELFFEMLYPDYYRKKHDGKYFASRFDGVRDYLTLGTVSLSPQGRNRLDKIIATRQHMERAGVFDQSFALHPA